MGSSLVIAIDGPAGSGKSTVAKCLAEKMGATLLDTGALYRVIALASKSEGIDWDDGPMLANLSSRLAIEFCWDGITNRVLLNGKDVSSDIRTPEISRGASRVSAKAEVRQALLGLQRKFAEKGSVVAEGRDMGTVVFPFAQVKVFLVADPKERARRRQKELCVAGHKISEEEVLREQNSRDTADEKRDIAPMRPAQDAHLIDTSNLSVKEVVEKIFSLIQTEDG